jgi:predicted phosphoribosyltransferase
LASAPLRRGNPPTRQLVGGNDVPVIEINQWALERMHFPAELRIVPGATHLFEEPGTLDQVVKEAIDWFVMHVGQGKAKSIQLPFADRRSAGRLLAERLQKFKQERPLVLALPRGGVPVAYEVAAQLGAPLDLLLVRKIGAPGHPEFGIGAVIDGKDPQILLNRDLLSQVPIGQAYINDEARRQLREIERRRDQYLGDREAISVAGRTVIVVDDGVATGSTVRIALRAIRQKQPAKLILAVPVGAADSIRTLASECDEVVCLAMPEPFRAVGLHYANFDQTTDEEVRQLLNSQLT